MSQWLNRIAPPGTIWICRSCFKSARDRLMFPGNEGRTDGCAAAALLCDESSIIRGVTGNILGANIVGDDGENPRERITFAEHMRRRGDIGWELFMGQETPE